MRSLLFLIISLFPFFCFSQAGTDSTFTNPVWDGADPWMVKQNNEYIYCWSANNSINISRSAKMTKQGETKKIWQVPASGWNRSCVWAPEIHFMLPENLARHSFISERAYFARKQMMYIANMKIWAFCTPAILLAIRLQMFGPLI